MKSRYLSGLPFVSVNLPHKEIECLLDTGFSGALLLPLSDVVDLDLKQEAFVEYLLADGSSADAPLYQTEIDWMGAKKEVSVIGLDSDAALIGMELLQYARTVMDPSNEILILTPNKENA